MEKIIPKKFLHCCKSYRPHNRCSNLDSGLPGSRKGTEIPRESDFEGQWDLITELPQDRGNKTLGGHKQNLMHTRTHEKGAGTDSTRDLPVSVWESPAEAWVNRDCSGVRGTEYNSPRPRSFRRSLPLLLPQFGLRPDRERTQPHPSAENGIKGVLRMALITRARPSFPHSQFLPSISLHKALNFIRGQTE